MDALDARVEGLGQPKEPLGEALSLRLAAALEDKACSVEVQGRKGGCCRGALGTPAALLGSPNGGEIQPIRIIIVVAIAILLPGSLHCWDNDGTKRGARGSSHSSR